MSAINNGEPAFPTQNGCRNDPGLSKREWFAGMALQGYLAGRFGKGREMHHNENHQAKIAEGCARYADAMIAALGKEES